MSTEVKINDDIDFSKARPNPFAKIADAARKNDGELSPLVSKHMMKEAIKELRRA